jgi:molecular chaperone GrpE
VTEASHKETAAQPPDEDFESAGSSHEANSLNEPEALRQALAAAEELARTQRDLYMRAVAEMDNVRKRAQRDADSAGRQALEGFINELLPVRDSLELAVRQGAQADAKALIEGQQATLKLLDRAFEKNAIEILNPVGEPFDPSVHEAVLMQPSDTAEPGSVLQVVQTGYELRGRLLRPARVIVARASDG